MLDIIKPVSRGVDELVQRTRSSILQKLELEEKMKTRSELMGNI